MNTLRSYKEIMAERARLEAEEAKAERTPLWRILSPGQMFAIIIIEAISLMIIGNVIMVYP